MFLVMNGEFVTSPLLPPAFCAGMGWGRGAGGVMLLYLICIIRRPDWVCMRVGGTFSSVHSIKLAADLRREMQNVKQG